MLVCVCVCSLYVVDMLLANASMTPGLYALPIQSRLQSSDYEEYLDKGAVGEGCR